MLVFALFATLSACTDGKNTGNSPTEDSAVNSMPESDNPDFVIKDSDVVTYKKLGLFASTVSSDNEKVADAVIRKGNDGVAVRAFSNGTARISVADYWGNKAFIDVTVENDSIVKEEVTAFADPNSVNVRLCGASGNGITNDTAAVQAAVDSLKNGGTVYFPAGKYLISQLVIGNNITLKLQGSVENVSEGYTDALAARVENGEFAVIVNALENSNLILNHDPAGSGADGASDIAVVGGMIDLNGSIADGKQVDSTLSGPQNCAKGKITGTCAFVFSCAKNFTLDNVIIKDSYNGHAMQLCAAQDVEVRNCMFAGFVCRANTAGSTSDILLTRETIQIEYAHSGAIPPSSFEAGEFYYCKNIKIDGCYFGDSDKCGYNLTPIGQHGQCGQANITGLEISNNVFDNPYYCGIRFPNYRDVKIYANKFISDTAGQFDGYFIDIFSLQGTSTYAGTTKSGISVTVTYAMPYEHDGTHNVEIYGNEFVISGNSNKRVISAASTGIDVGAKTVKSLIRQVSGTLYGNSYTGFVKSSNIVSNVNVHDNTINISGEVKYKNFHSIFTMVHDLKYENNSVTLGSGISFTSSSNGIEGLNIYSPIDRETEVTLTFDNSLKDKYLIIPDGSGGYIKLCSDTAGTVRKIKLVGSEHIRLGFTIDSDNNAVVNIECDEGYSFSGWKLSGEKYGNTGTVMLTGDITLTV